MKGKRINKLKREKDGRKASVKPDFNLISRPVHFGLRVVLYEERKCMLAFFFLLLSFFLSFFS